MPLHLSWLRPAAPVLALSLACGDAAPSAGILVVIDSELSIPKSVSKVGLYVQQIRDGVRTAVLSQEATPLIDGSGAPTVRFAASLAVQSGPEVENTRLHVRFLGYDSEGRPIAMREARVAVPDAGVYQMRLPLRFIHEGTVEEAPGQSVQALGIRQTQDPPDDVFTRYRSIGCDAEQRLDDSGACAPLDVDLASLERGDVLTPNGTCFSAEACFASGPGVRALPLRGCVVEVPRHTGSDLAVAVPAGSGYTTGNDRVPSAQPIDPGLFTFDGTTLTLLPPLCRRLDRVDTVLVSTRCAPRALTEPICAPWQTVSTPEPTRDERFLDDPVGPEDASVADASDGSAHRDAGDAEPSDDGFDRYIAVDAADDYTSLDAMAARPDGSLVLLFTTGDGSNHVLRRSPANGALGVSRNLPFPLPSAYLEMGTGANTYIIPTINGANFNPWVLLENDSLSQLKLGTNCSATSNETTFFTVGMFDGKPIAAFATSSQPEVSGSEMRDGDPTCFPDAPPGSGNTSTYLERGSTFGGKWRLPMVHDTKLLGLDPGLSTLSIVRTDNNYALQSFIDLGNDDAIVTARKIFNGSSYTGAYFRASLVDGDPVIDDGAPLKPPVDGTWMHREVFGGDGTLCARVLTGVTTGDFTGIECLKRNGAGFDAFGELGLSAVSNMHVYGDSNYAYFAKLCFGPTRAERVHVIGRPWAKVSAQTLLDLPTDCGDPG